MQTEAAAVETTPKPRRSRAKKSTPETAPVETVETSTAEPVEATPPAASETPETAVDAETSTATAAATAQESPETAQGEAIDTQKVESILPSTVDAVQAATDVQATDPKNPPVVVSFSLRGVPEFEAALSELKERRSWEAQIESINDRVQELEADFKEKKEAASAAKKRWESAQSHLSEVIAKGRERLPLFDRPREVEAEPVAVVPIAATPTPTPAAEPWRAVRLDVLQGMTPSILAALAEAGIETIGAITDHTAKGKRLTEIKGIGEAAHEKIDDALAGFWAGQSEPADALEGETDKPTKPRKPRKAKAKTELSDPAAALEAAESDPNLDAVAAAAEAGHFDAAENLAIEAIGAEPAAEASPISDADYERIDAQDAEYERGLAADAADEFAGHIGPDLDADDLDDDE